MNEKTGIYICGSSQTLFSSLYNKGPTTTTTTTIFTPCKCIFIVYNTTTHVVYSICIFIIIQFGLLYVNNSRYHMNVMLMMIIEYYMYMNYMRIQCVCMCVEMPSNGYAARRRHTQSNPARRYFITLVNFCISHIICKFIRARTIFQRDCYHHIYKIFIKSTLIVRKIIIFQPMRTCTCAFI